MTRRLALLLLAAAATQAAPISIYDGSLNTNPQAQGWSYGAQSGSGGSAAESMSGGATILTTTAPERAGFSIFSPITLDRTTGYQVTFDLQLDAESHSSNDRAGLSVIVLGSDHTGIELGFWTPVGSPVNEVWAQNAGFTHGEGAVFDTTQRTLYTLTVSGSSYDLTAGGTQLITGALRDYSGFGLPYTLPDFIFVGDDTFSADASTRFFAATVDTPEPASFVLGGLALAGMVLRRSYRAISAAR